MKYIFLFFSTFILAQSNKLVDFKTANAQLNIDCTHKKIGGKVRYTFMATEALDTLKIDAQNMQFSSVSLNDKAVSFHSNGKQLWIIYDFKKRKYHLDFMYEAQPKQALYFIGGTAANSLQIWTQGQGKYTSHWFPSFDDVNEKVIFNLEVTFDKKYEVIANGILKDKSTNTENYTWKYTMQKPMSSYLLMLAIGKFEKKTGHSDSGIPLEWYYEVEDFHRFEPTYRDSKTIFNFMESATGMRYPWGIYKQIPVRDFIYAGMENTTATTFMSHFVVDSIAYFDRKYTNVNAHELAHHWFGNLITAKNSKHHWLQEGFATYFALLAEKKLFGEDYFYNYLYEKAQQLKFASRTDTIPVLHPKASSLTFYEKGAWALFVLHQKIGDAAFKKAIHNYLKKHAFETVETQDFFDEIHKVTQFDSDTFSKVWLEDYRFNTMEANELLRINPSINRQLEIDQLKTLPFENKKDFLLKEMHSEISPWVKERIILQLKNENYDETKEIVLSGLHSGNLSIRQKIASLYTKVPDDLKSEYESLLLDASYQTQEIALFNLWNSFKEERFKYLTLSKNWKGFKDYNLRILWLGLALNTEEFESEWVVLSKELCSYTAENFEATTRQNAFEVLLNIQYITPEVLKNLVNATTHHMWQFSKFARTAIRNLLKNPSQRATLEKLLTELSDAEQYQLNRLLQEK